MKATISSTYDDLYLWNLPLVTWCWNKLGADVVCFMPDINIEPHLRDDNWSKSAAKISLIHQLGRNGIIRLSHPYFTSPKNKESTYAQCSRLYGACLDLPEDEILITGDVDMAVFQLPPNNGCFTIFGADLVPPQQYPMCYASGTVNEWRTHMAINGKTVQQCLDDLLGDIQAEHFRGNYWGKDQEELWAKTNHIAYTVPRARPGTQFASHRIDRDDAYWEERLSPEIIDAHLWRPGYTDENFPKILRLMKYFYPEENFDWLVEYTEQYKKLL